MAVVKGGVEVLNPREVPLEPWSMARARIREGQPMAKVCVVGRSPDKRSFSGVWTCTPGMWDVTYPWDETIYVIEGRVTIEDRGGPTREFKAGDVVHFPIGLQCTWTVHETIRKVFSLFSPEPLDL